METGPKLLLGVSSLCLAIFGLLALFCPLGMMNWIGFGHNSDIAIIEFMSFYGGLEIGLSMLLLLPNRLFGLKEKLLCVLFIFASVGLTRLFATLCNELNSVFLTIAAFEIVLALAAVHFLLRLRQK